MPERPLDQYAPLMPLEACAELDSSPQGLTDDEAAARLARYGPNALSDDLDSWSLRRLLSPFVNWITVLLLIAGILAFISQTPEIGYVILVVALLNGLFTVWQEYQAEKAIAALRHLLPEESFVRRDARPLQVPTSTVVPGDILPVGPGTVLVADGYLVASEGLRVRQTLLTGNNAPVTKVSGPLPDPTLALTERPNMLLAGTQVIEGQGSLLAVATGMRTQLGIIAQDTAALRGEQSPFVRALNQLAATISRVAIVAGVLTFLLMAFAHRLPLQDSLIFAISMIVAFVPEGLLPTVTLALAIARRRLQREHVLVKHLADVESLGSATVLCLDKTDALTTGTLMVTNVWAGDVSYRVTGSGAKPDGEFLNGDTPVDPAQERDLLALLRAAVLCSNARLLAPDDESPEWRIVGGPVEGALVLAGARAGLDAAAVTDDAPRLQTPPYDPRRRMMTVVVSEHDAGNYPAGYLRGMPNAVLPLCSFVRRGGEDLPLSEAQRDSVADLVDRYARAGKQVLAVAGHRLEPRDDSTWTMREIEDGMTLLGLLALQEPPQPEVARLVEGCRRAGMRIMLTTGAYGLTAEASGRRAGIITEEHVRIVHGVELADLRDDELDATLADRATIFAQLDSGAKRRVVARLQARGEVVAFLGDSINDAPALKQSDIGVAISASGTTVALAAADMVLDADHPAGLLSGIEEGRAIFENVQKFSTYIFTHNIAETIAVVAAVLAGIPLPLTVLQVLAIDLGSELFPSIAISLEPPEPGVMDEPPRRRDAPLLSQSILLRSFAWLGLIEGTLALLAFGLAFWSAGWRPGLPLPADATLYAQATTLTYAAIVLAQVGTAFASRTRRAPIWQIGLTSNRALLLGIGVSLAVMLSLIYIPPLADTFNMVPPSLAQWGFLLTFPFIMLFAEEGRKALVRQRRQAG